MADGGVIKEFLVGLGWKIDKSSQRGFETALEDSKRAALGLVATLTGVVAAVTKVAQSYEQLEYASQRAQSTVAGMQKFAFAISEMGGNADAARGSLQAMGNFLRATPGGEGFIQRLGVQTRDANGAMRDTSSIMIDLGKQFRNMPYWRARASAGMLGIDENTLQAMIRGVGNFGEKYAAIYKRLGIDQNQAAKASTQFMQQFRLMGAVITAVRDKLAISLEPVIDRGIDLLYQFEEWVHRLDGSTKGWIAGIGAFIAVWRLMNTAIMQSPIGRVIALGAAIAALYDDYKAWQSGGKSLINWKEWQPGIDAVISGIKQLSEWFNNLDGTTKTLIETIGEFLLAWRLFNAGFAATPVGAVLTLGAAIAALYSDYKTWQAGGKALINWDEWKPGIDAAIDAISQIKTLLGDMWTDTSPYLKPMADFIKHEMIDAFLSLGRVVGGVARSIDKMLHGNFSGALSDIKSVYAELQRSGQEGTQVIAGLASKLAGGLPGIDAAIDAIEQVKHMLSDLWPDIEPSANSLLNFFKHAFMDSLKSTGQAIGWIARAIDDLLHHNFRAVWSDIKGAASQGLDNVKDLGRSAAGVGSAVVGGLAGMDAGRVNDAMKYLTSHGIDRDHALAMIGNWQQESNLGANLGTGSHRGLEQWDDSRRAAIMQNTGIDVTTANFPDQMRAALWELRNGSEAGHFQQFLKTTGVNEAAGYFAQNIERSGEKPGDHGFDARLAYAHSAAAISNFGGIAGNQAPTVNQTVTINGATNPQSVADSVVRVTHSAVNTAYRNFVPRRQ